jgi:hypothetical protein
MPGVKRERQHAPKMVDDFPEKKIGNDRKSPRQRTLLEWPTKSPLDRILDPERWPGAPLARTRTIAPLLSYPALNLADMSEASNTLIANRNAAPVHAQTVEASEVPAADRPFTL